MESLAVPYFTISTMAYTATSGTTAAMRGYLGTTYYAGPNQALLRLAMGIAIQGVVPPSVGPSLNSSYTISFNAPTVQCRNTTSAPLHDFLSTNMVGYCNRSGYGNSCPTTWYTYQCVSWTPLADALVPWGVDELNVTEPISFASTSTSGNLSSYLGQYEGSPPSAFVATLRPNSSIWEVLNCSFYDATYDVHFNFTNGISTANIKRIRIDDNPLTLSTPINSSGVSPNDPDGPVGSSQTISSKHVGYQALMESFGRVIVGTLGLYEIPNAYDGGTTGSFTIESTSVLDTNLAYSNELAPISTYPISPPSCDYGGCVQYIPISSASSSEPPPIQKTLGASIEELFENVTLALFSDHNFVNNEDIPQVEVAAVHMVTKVPLLNETPCFGLWHCGSLCFHLRTNRVHCHTRQWRII
jgi:hypothetical protein